MTFIRTRVRLAGGRWWWWGSDEVRLSVSVRAAGSTLRDESAASLMCTRLSQCGVMRFNFNTSMFVAFASHLTEYGALTSFTWSLFTERIVERIYFWR